MTETLHMKADAAMCPLDVQLFANMMYVSVLSGVSLHLWWQI